MSDQLEVPLPIQFLKMATGKMVSKPIYVAAKLGISDQLTAGPLSVDELAKRTHTHSGALYRLLRALASCGIYAEVSPKTFGLTPLAEVFLDVPGSPRGMVLWFGDPAHDRAWENLLYSVQTGKPGWDEAHGKPFFEYLKENRELSEVFNRAMTGNSQNLHNSIVEAYPFTGVHTLYDIGGGHGHLLKLILEKHKQLKGGVVDLGHVVEGAKTALASLSDRCVFHGASFFEKLPQGADAHILSFVLHDWSDEECKTILHNSYEALPKNGKLFLAENIIEPGNEPAFGKLLDMEMLVVATGRERTRQEFSELLASSGFELKAVYPTKSPISLIEALKR